MKKIFFALFLFLAPAFASGCAQSVSVFGGVTLAGPCAGNAAIARTAPAGFPALPIMPKCVLGAGNVVVNTTLEAAFKAAYPSVAAGPYIIVDQDNGNDSTCVVSSGQTCLTISKAVRGTTATRIYVRCPASGVITVQGSGPLDFRFTDTGGAAPKLLYSQTPGCKLRYAGDNIGTNTWTATPGHPGIYQTTIASAVAGTSGDVSLVMRADGTTDGSGFVDLWGRPFPKRLQAALPNQWHTGFTYASGQYVWNGSYVCYQALSSNFNSTPPSASWTSCGDMRTNDTPGLSNLDILAAANIDGYYNSTATHTLYAYFGGLALTDPTVAAKLQARYYPQGNSFGTGIDPRVFAYGTVLFLQGFFLDGIGVETAQFSNSGTYVSPIVYEQDDTIFGSLSYGTLVRGAHAYAQRVVAHANSGDGCNGDVGTDGVTSSVMEQVAVHNTWAGDPSTYDSGVLPNRFPNANGCSSHNGYAAYIGSIFEENAGPDLADSSNPSTSPVFPSATWIVGSIARNMSPQASGNGGGFQMGGVAGSTAGDSRNRVFWIDTSASYNEGPAPLGVVNNATCHTYNNTFDQPIFYLTALPCVAYTPTSP